MQFKASQTTKTGMVVHVYHSSVQEAELQKEDCFVFKVTLVYIMGTMDIPGLYNIPVSKTQKETKQKQINKQIKPNENKRQRLHREAT